MTGPSPHPENKKPLAGKFARAAKARASAATAAAPNIIALSKLRATQITVGMQQVEHKQEKLQELRNRPSELMDLILDHAIRVVMGPDGNAYVIDHHHFALAMIREGYETAPIEVVEDFSQKKMSMPEFWKTMQDKKYVHPMDAEGKERPLSEIPQHLTALKDDPYRSLAGFVREAFGFKKMDTPFAEFQWADYFRKLIPKAEVQDHFHKALKQALKLCRLPGAKDLPGYTAGKFAAAAKPQSGTSGGAAGGPAAEPRPVMELAQLMPTQMTVGMKMVEHKQEKLAALKKRPAELLDLFLEHTIPVVMGPGGKAYVIDHHHFALALIREGFETAPVKVVADYSELSPDKFWKKMQDMKYCHPMDAQGKEQPVSAIPKRMTALKDDPYRALAGFVREALGFKKVDTPFTEFKWADYFRKLIPLKLVTDHFHKALKQALKVCHLTGAKGLPGYKPR